MKTLVRCLFVLLASVPARANPEFDPWVESFAQEWLRALPTQATMVQYLPAADQDAADRQLVLIGSDGLPLDPAHREALAARAARGLARLETFPPASLTATQRTSAAFLRWSLQIAREQAAVSDQRYVFDQFFGAQVLLVMTLTEFHPFRRARDVENYLERLAQAGPQLDAAAAEAQRRGERGVVPPRFILDATMTGLDRFLTPEPAQNMLVETLARGAAKATDLSPETRADAVRRAEAIVRDSIRPAFTRVKALLAAQRATATDDAGAWKLPRGAALYAASLASFTTTRFTADEIHAIGRREVARIEAEMDRLLQELGYRQGSVAARYAELQTKLLPPESPDPRPAILAEITRYVREAETRARPLFDELPRAPLEVRREPAFTEAGAAARYTQPAPDGTRPGVYWVPLARIAPDVLWLGAGTRTVAYHEAVPGHHFQIALQQENRELPRFRQQPVFGFIAAYAEGWALYAERLADEAGWYEGDIPGRLGYLSAQLFRAKRLVVDTGLHAQKWTRRQAVEFGIQESEVDRYVVWPGQACAYMIGQLRILELRERARQALGDRFSLREFHRLVLQTGAVPLDVLTEVVDAWIAAKR